MSYELLTTAVEYFSCLLVRSQPQVSPALGPAPPAPLKEGLWQKLWLSFLGGGFEARRILGQSH